MNPPKKNNPPPAAQPPAGQPPAETPPPEDSKPVAEVAPEFLKRSGWEKKPEPPPAEDPNAGKPKGDEPEGGDKPKRKIAAGYEKAASLKKEDVTTIAEAAGTAAATAVRQSMPAPAPTPPPGTEPKPKFEMTPAIQKQISVMRKMGELKEDYKSLAGNLVKFLGDYDAAKRKWEAEHPDEEFDADDKIADSMKVKLGVDWKDEDYDEAAERLLVEPANQKVEALEQRLQQLEEERRVESLAPVAGRVGVEAAHQLVAALGDEVKELIGEKLTGEIVKNLPEADPVIGTIVQEEILAAKNFGEATVRVFNNADHPLRLQVAKFCVDQEQAILKSKAEDQKDEAGRQFIPRSEYAKMSADDRAALDAGKHEKFWYLNQDTVVGWGTAVISDRAKRRVKAAQDTFNKALEKRGLKVDVAPARRAAAPQPKPAAPAADDSGEDNEPPPVNDLERIHRRPNSPSSLSPMPAPKSGASNSEAPGFAGRFTRGTGGGAVM